jgi:hypothetical protein
LLQGLRAYYIAGCKDSTFKTKWKDKMRNILDHKAIESIVEAWDRYNYRWSSLSLARIGGLGKKSDFVGIIFILLLLWGFLDSEFEGTQHGKSVVLWLGPVTHRLYSY